MVPLVPKSIFGAAGLFRGCGYGCQRIHIFFQTIALKATRSGVESPETEAKERMQQTVVVVIGYYVR